MKFDIKLFEVRTEPAPDCYEREPLFSLDFLMVNDDRSLFGVLVDDIGVIIDLLWFRIIEWER